MICKSSKSPKDLNQNAFSLNQRAVEAFSEEEEVLKIFTITW